MLRTHGSWIRSRCGIACAMGLAAIASGCGDVELPDVDISLPGTESSESVANQGTNTEQAASGDVTDSTPAISRSPEQMIAAFAAKASFSITDADVTELAALQNGLDKVTELDLGGSSITASSINALTAFEVLTELNLEGCRISGAELEPLSKLTQLQRLNVSRSGVDDASLKHIGALESLQYLNLSETRVTDAGFVHLSGLSSLEELQISRLRVTGTGMEALGKKGARAPLRTISAGKTEFGRMGFVFLKEFGDLESLEVQSSLVTDGSLEGLRGCNSLRRLNLSGNMITDLGVSDLSRLKDLESIELKGMNTVSDASVQRLRSLKHLNMIDLNGTSCTESTVQSLKKSLPDCLVRLNEQEY